MADFEENVEDMVGTTREAAAVATESGGDEIAMRPRTRRGTKPVVPAGTRPATRWRRQLVMRWRRPVGNVYGRRGVRI